MISESKASKRWCLARGDNGESYFLPEERICWKKCNPSGCGNKNPEKEMMLFDFGITW